MKLSQILAETREAVLAVIAGHPVDNPRLFGPVARGADKEGGDLGILIGVTGQMSSSGLVGLGRL
jgi:uncharacterized protein